MKELWNFLKWAWRFRKNKAIHHLTGLMESRLYARAQEAVKQVSGDTGLQILGNTEGQVSYCPRCGQRPSHDVRHDEAFEIAYGKLAPAERSLELHFALELAYWMAQWQ